MNTMKVRLMHNKNKLKLTITKNFWQKCLLHRYIWIMHENSKSKKNDEVAEQYYLSNK